VKKPTNKYCSVHCCAIDPERLERLRAQAQRARAAPCCHSPPALTGESGAVGANPEAEIDILGEGREDVPRGMFPPGRLTLPAGAVRAPRGVRGPLWATRRSPRDPEAPLPYNAATMPEEVDDAAEAGPPWRLRSA